MQKSSINNFLVLCTNTMVLIATLVYPSGSNDTNVIVMAVIHAITVALPLLVATIVVFFGEATLCRTKHKMRNENTYKKCSFLGWYFLLDSNSLYDHYEHKRIFNYKNSG